MDFSDLLHTIEGQPSSAELVSEHTVCPNVDLFAILLRLVHLRRQWEVRSHALAHSLLLGQNRGEAEVGNADVALPVKLNVLGFEVAMDAAAFVHVLKHLAHTPECVLGEVIADLTLTLPVNILLQGTALHELHDNKVVVSVIEAIHQRYLVLAVDS